MVLGTWRIIRKLANADPVPLPCLVKLWRWLFWEFQEDIWRTMQSQDSLMRMKPNLTISFYNEVTHLADQRKPVDTIFLDFSHAFNTVSHRSLLDKMSSRQQDKPIMPWGEHLAHGLDTKCCGVHHPGATTGVPHSSTAGPVLFKVLINN